jgi:hypothetical protein
VFNLLQQMQALGLNVPAVLQQLGIHPEAAATAAASPAAPAVAAVVVPPKLD